MNQPIPHIADKAVDSIQQRLTEYACGLTYEQLSPAAIHTAKARVIDTLGVLIGGFFGEPCRITRNLAAKLPIADGVTVIGTRMKTSPEMAAFANATTARLLEFTDVYHSPGSAHGHPSDLIMPVLAAAEHVQARGRDFLAAVVLGYEVFCQISSVFDKTAFCNTNIACLATAVAAGKLFRLRSEELAHCISMAVVANNILIQVRKDHLSMWKEVAAGQAGRAGVYAALLAQAGMEGPHLPFEGKAGWCDHVALKRFTLDGPMGGAHTPFRILDTRIKMRPCEGEMISSVIAAEKVAPLGNVTEVKQITVETNEHARWLVGSNIHRPVWNPDSREVADHSIPYVVAAALTDGTLTPRSYDDHHLWNPQLRGLLAKIEVVANPEFTAAYKGPQREHHARVTVIMNSGERFVGETMGGGDDLAAPKSDAQIMEKFSGLAGDVLGTQRMAALLDRLWHLEDVENIAEIPAALVFA